MVATKPTAAISTISMPALLIKIESAAVAIGAIAFFIHLGGSGLLFVLLILAPDLSMIGYAANPRTGSVVYNIVHTYVVPAVLTVIALMTGSELLLQIALIWFVHIGADRLLGFGLKYPTEFKDTHLQHI
jgi:hypothetical protein